MTDIIDRKQNKANQPKKQNLIAHAARNVGKIEYPFANGGTEN